MRQLQFGEVRKLHPDELLASLSFQQHELPRLSGSWNEQYSKVCQTICVNVFEAFAAEALAAMGLTAPRDALRRQVTADQARSNAQASGGAAAAGHGDEPGVDGLDPGEVHAWLDQLEDLEPRSSPQSLPYEKYKPLKDMPQWTHGDEQIIEDDRLLMLGWNGVDGGG